MAKKPNPFAKKGAKDDAAGKGGKMKGGKKK